MGLVLITHLVRPTLTGAYPWVVFIFGVLPNFGAGLGIPFIMQTILKRILEFRKHTIKPMVLFLVCSAISLIGISVWEVTGGTIDPYDLVASAAGITCALCAYLVINLKIPSDYGE